MSFKVNSPNVKHSDTEILSDYMYQTTDVTVDDSGNISVTPVQRKYTFKTKSVVPKLGVMLVGWGGNNGSTVTAAMIANKENITWRTKTGVQTPDYFGSLTQSSTIRVGLHNQKELYIPFKQLLPIVDPNDLVISGWDINSANLAESMERAQVLDFDLQRQLVPFMKDMKPLPAIFVADFIAANQEDRANNILTGTKQEQMDKVRQDIREFKFREKLDKVIVLWTANTERFCDVREGLNDTAENLLSSIARNESEVSPSSMYAVASILEGCSYINGSPQNTLLPGVVELALRHRVYIGGDDFKSGQTKMKSVLVDFLVGAGLKPVSIVSYNHLGNNDGKNLSAPQQFRSKEISKSNVVDDMVNSNSILYKPNEHPDHVVVIKYVPYVGDSKRAMDEYTTRIFMGGHNTIVMHNTCEDSLLAAPLIFDLVLLTELMERISWKTEDMEEFDNFHSVLSILSYLFKAPNVPEGTPVINALAKQRACVENLLRACVGLPPENSMLLEAKCIKSSERL